MLQVVAATRTHRGNNNQIQATLDMYVVVFVRESLSEKASFSQCSCSCSVCRCLWIFNTCRVFASWRPVPTAGRRGSAKAQTVRTVFPLLPTAPQPCEKNRADRDHITILGRSSKMRPPRYSSSEMHFFSSNVLAFPRPTVGQRCSMKC